MQVYYCRTSKVNDLLGYNMFDDWLLRENPYHSVEGEILNYALTIYNDEEVTTRDCMHEATVVK